MPIKGTIDPDHIPVTKYTLSVAGGPPLTPISIGGLEEEIAVIELPDKTVATSGRSGPVALPMTIPSHHIVEVAFCELWLQEGQDPVTPTYKKPTTLLLTSLTGNTQIGFTLPDAFLSKRALEDRDLSNDGDMSTHEFTINASQMLPLPIA
jgi:hypothetical protein